MIYSDVEKFVDAYRAVLDRDRAGRVKSMTTPAVGSGWSLELEIRFVEAGLSSDATIGDGMSLVLAPFKSEDDASAMGDRIVERMRNLTPELESTLLDIGNSSADIELVLPNESVRHLERLGYITIGRISIMSGVEVELTDRGRSMSGLLRQWSQQKEQ